MRHEDGLTPAEREMESALRRLRPAGPAIDRDAMMFRLGRVSVRRRGLAWQILSGGLAVALAVSLAARPAPRPIVQVVEVPAAQPAEPARPGESAITVFRTASALPDDAYIHVRERVLQVGLDALPQPPETPGPWQPRRLAAQVPSPLKLTDLLPFGTQLLR